MITIGTKRCSERKQRLYLKFLKTKKECQDFKKLFEYTKKLSKKLYFSKLILKYKDNIKKLCKSLKKQ